MNRRGFLTLGLSAAAGAVSRTYFDLGPSWRIHDSGLSLRAWEEVQPLAGLIRQQSAYNALVSRALDTLERQLKGHAPDSLDAASFVLQHSGWDDDAVLVLGDECVRVTRVTNARLPTYAWEHLLPEQWPQSVVDMRRAAGLPVLPGKPRA